MREHGLIAWAQTVKGNLQLEIPVFQVEISLRYCRQYKYYVIQFSTASQS